MKLSRFSVLIHSIVGITLLALPTLGAYSQGATPQRESSENVLGRLSAAFSSGKVVQSVQLSGNATWYAGNLEDTGTVILTASSDGSTQMQLALAATGQKTESQTGSGLSATCQWAGANGVAHAVNSVSCGRPVPWFLPSLSLQPSLLSSNLGVADLGMGTVGASTNTHRHLQGQLTFNGTPDALTADAIQMSKTDIGLNPTSLLPAVLSYSVRPDSGAPIAIAIEVRYSNYRAVSGVQIPFLIQRYVNGSLQLEVHVSSAEIN
jgi:hypothetical protein